MKKILLLLLMFFIFAAVGFAEVPNEIRYTGRLKSYQTLVNDTVSMTFKLYYNETGGNSVWSSNAVNVSVSSGIFTYVLKPTGVDWSKGDIWLELTVGTNILTPREKLMAQPYSFHSATAEKLYSNNEISIQIGTTTAYIGVSNNRMYFKLLSSSNIEYLGVPPGTVIAYAGTNIPAGYLLCDGREVAISDYPDLFASIGSLYGTATSGKFKLPNLQGMFLRGYGEQTQVYPQKDGVNSTVYKAAEMGQFQGDSIRNITGLHPGMYGKADEYYSGANYVDGQFASSKDRQRKYTTYDGWEWGFGKQYFDASRVVPTTTENRPANYAVCYCIKY
ncbi:MAG: phage tail protein [Endomicrobium sp.]|jgi:hypothetical protein|nr:phage tail protein [Endomicrobium sp.]